MALTVITTPARRHLGTMDPATGGFYDYPGKAEGCEKAARNFVAHTHAEHGTNRGSVPARVIEVSSTDDRAETIAGLVHPQRYIDSLKSASEAVRVKVRAGEVEVPHDFGEEAMVSSETDKAALDSIEAVLEAYEILLADPTGTVHVTTRTPGHHARPEQALGFCYLNQAAVLARFAAHNGEKVSVIDIDHHDGNGTCEALAGQINIHVTDLCGRTPFDQVTQTYDGLVYDKVEDEWVRGSAEFPYQHDSPSMGRKATPSVFAENITRLEFWDKPYQQSKHNPQDRGTAPEIIAERFIREALPAIEALSPSLIVISLGVDSLQGDPVGGQGQTSGSLHLIVRGLRERFPSAKVMTVMEGGYHEEGWTRGIPPVLAALHADLGTKEGLPAITKRFLGAMIDSPYRDAILACDPVECVKVHAGGDALNLQHPWVEQSVEIVAKRSVKGSPERKALEDICHADGARTFQDRGQQNASMSAPDALEKKPPPPAVDDHFGK